MHHSGDDGTSAVFGGRETKAAEVFEALGWLDELNAAIGVLRTECPAEIGPRLREVQIDLSKIMATVSGHASAGAVDVSYLERWIDEAGLDPPKAFLVPGDGGRASAIAHVARTRCRTAERALARWESDLTETTHAAQIYLNRLSDYLFVVSRMIDE